MSVDEGNDVKKKPSSEQKIKNILQDLKKVRKDDESEKNESKNDTLQALKQRDEEILNLQKTISELQEKNLRNLAMIDNLQKRGLEDVKRAEQKVKKNLIKETLEIYDNLLLAMKNIENSINEEGAQDESEGSIDGEKKDGDDTLLSIKKGLDITMNIFIGLLKKHKIERVAEIGVPFDYNIHQALQSIKSDEVESGQVAQVVKAGYIMDGESLVTALVIIAE